MRLVLSILLIILCSAAQQARAGEVISAGTPAPANMTTTPYDDQYRDIYQRQLQYREEALEHSRRLKERQENYAEPQRRAYSRYQADIESLNNGRGDSPATSSDMTDEELELQMMLSEEEAYNQ